MITLSLFRQAKVRHRAYASYKAAIKGAAMLLEKHQHEPNMQVRLYGDGIDESYQHSEQLPLHLFEPKPRDFRQTRQWRVTLRGQALARDNYACTLCGKTAREGAVLEVDHIKPMALYPELKAELSNLQTLCKECHEFKTEQDRLKYGAKALSQKK